MPTPLQTGGRRRALVAAAATALLAALGLVLIVVGTSGPPTPSAATPRTSVPTQDAPPAATTRESAENGRGASTGHRAAADPGRSPDFGPVLPGSPPVGLDIPRIGVRSTDIVGLGFQKDGSIEVPRNPASPGWFTPGPSPGQYGPAVIAGHVDSATGPAVFYRLGELRPGDRITVTREDGTAATFTVDRVKAVEKDAFPTREVYGATDRAELRLITCSGEYDQQDGYDGNTIVFAHLT
jgi:LPXTG-site transpeptidase (sortase) family protein